MTFSPDFIQGFKTEKKKETQSQRAVTGSKGAVFYVFPVKFPNIEKKVLIFAIKTI